MDSMRCWVLGVLVVAALGCSHPRDPGDTAEARAGIRGFGDDAPRERWPRVFVEAEPVGVSGVSGGQPTPRYSTPGGIAAGLHGTPVAGDPPLMPPPNVDPGGSPPVAIR